MERKIWFEKEAQCWEEALPIGNGRLGAMVFGGVETETLQLNEDSIWYGGPRDRINPDAHDHLEQVRELILCGRPDEAEELLRYTFTATPQSQRIYQPLADCTIRMKTPNAASEYARSLDLNEAVTEVSYRTAKGSISRECFSSAKRNVIVLRMQAQGEEELSFDVLLTREKFYDEMNLDQPDRVFLTGNLGKGGLDFAVGAKISVEGGSFRRLGEHLVVRRAKSATLYLAGTSTFYEKNLLQALNTVLDEAAQIPYGELKKEHVADYQQLFGRVSLQLPKEEGIEKLTTPARLERVRNGASDPALLALYFDFGRYLLISCSREKSLPATLQGIWNHRMMPPWESKYTININTEMNYWPAESCGLPECMEPVFSLLKRMRESGAKTAREMYGCRGFLAHHNTDIWADTAPQDVYIPATYWTQGGAWMSLFLWRHFEYNQDKEFLEEYFPILEDAVLFYLDFLVEDQGEYVTCPSVSPENTYIMENGVQARVCAGPAMDNEILTDLFDAYLQACRVLVKEGYRSSVEEYRKKLPPIRIGKHGQIMEWREDYDELEPGHRHISQLYALYPSSQITVDETPRLAEAAEKTLARRLTYGGGHTGWSAAWIVNLYAQLGKGEEALHMLRHLFTQSTFDNLMDNHPHVLGPVFQIEGNLGGCDAIGQMLLQDNGRRILLLPACPAKWTEGSLTGIRLKGNARIDLHWNEHEVTGEITAFSDWKQTLVYGQHRQEISLKKGSSESFRFAAAAL